MDDVLCLNLIQFFYSNLMFISTTIIRLISVVETSQKKEVKSASHKDAKIQS